MIIILLGPPGAGKGTIAEEIKKKIDIPVISTGDVLRNVIQKGTDLGKKAQEYVHSGKLVPDSLIMEIIEKRIQQEEYQEGFMFDGFPRTVQQGKALESLNEKLGKRIDQVFYFKASHEVIIERLSSRRVCSQCGATHNINYNPPKIADQCDKCGGKLIQRDDDKEETIKKRLEVYNNETLPLVDYYYERGIITKIDADRDVEDRFKDTWERLIELGLVEDKS
jgi:adenylate kinase